MTDIYPTRRDQLQCEYVERIVDGMDMDDLISMVCDYLHESLDKYTEKELLTEVEEYYPDLLD